MISPPWVLSAVHDPTRTRTIPAWISVTHCNRTFIFMRFQGPIGPNQMFATLSWTAGKPLLSPPQFPVTIYELNNNSGKQRWQETNIDSNQLGVI